MARHDDEHRRRSVPEHERSSAEEQHEARTTAQLRPEVLSGATTQQELEQGAAPPNAAADELPRIGNLHEDERADEMSNRGGIGS